MTALQVKVEILFNQIVKYQDFVRQRRYFYKRDFGFTEFLTWNMFTWNANEIALQSVKFTLDRLSCAVLSEQKFRWIFP